MQITKLGHACVRLRSGDTTLVIDPGTFTERGATDGADAVLITHEHFDHFTIEHLQSNDAPIITIAAVADQIAELDPAVHARVTVITPGQSFEAAGLPVEALGEMHAVIHPDNPSFFNSGYLVRGEQTVFHPGDAFTVPDEPVDVLLAPVSGPWNKVGEVVDFARAVKAPRVLAIHELVASDIGLGMIDQRMAMMLEPYEVGYQRVNAGEDMAL